jgi:hypothetical protein
MNGDWQRFAIKYGAFRRLLEVMALGPRFSHVDVGASEVKVAMGWGFRAKIPRTSITQAAESKAMGLGIGVHGFNGRWLVNGSMSGIVSIDIEPRARGFVMGIPVKLRQLHVSVEDPAGLIAALRR